MNVDQIKAIAQMMTSAELMLNYWDKWSLGLQRDREFYFMGVQIERVRDSLSKFNSEMMRQRELYRD